MVIGKYDLSEGFMPLCLDLRFTTSIEIHCFWGTRLIHPAHHTAAFSIDDIANRAIALLRVQKKTGSLSDRDITYALEVTNQLITLYGQFKDYRSCLAHFFKWLWECLGCQSTDAQQIAALQAIAQEVATMPFEDFKLRFNDSSQAKLAKDSSGAWQHPDLEGTYAEEEPKSVRMTLQAFANHFKIQNDLLPST